MQASSAIPLIYEDNHILVALKAPGLPSQAGKSGRPDMLGLLKADLAMRHQKPGQAFLGLVHRLDQPVSGLMVFAKTSKAAARLSEAFRTRKVKKYYLALVRDLPRNDGGRMEDYLSKKEIGGRVQREDPKEGSLALLDWQVLARYEERGEALLLIDLITGRRHQIRAQLALRDLPLLGDRRYGRMDERDGEVPGPALHAAGLVFPHPTLKKEMAFWEGPWINPSFGKIEGEAFAAYLERHMKQE